MNKSNSSLSALISALLVLLLGIVFICGAIFGNKIGQMDPLSRVSFGLVGAFFIGAAAFIIDQIVNVEIDGAFEQLQDNHDSSEVEDSMACLHTDEYYTQTE